MRHQEIRRRVEGLQGLPTTARAKRYFKHLFENPAFSDKQLERAAGSDPAIATKLLRHISSSFYGFPERIPTLSDSLTLLGRDMARGLILSTPVIRGMEKRAQSLWRHSLGVSVVAGKIACRSGSLNIEEVLLAGLLHDIGKLMIMFLFPMKVAAIDKVLSQEQVYSFEAESRVVGADHCEIGDWACLKWRFPLVIREAVAYHHRPDLAHGARKAASAVHLADILVKGQGLSAWSDRYVPPLKGEAWRSLGLTFSQVEEVIQEMGDQIRNIELLEPFPG